MAKLNSRYGLQRRMDDLETKVEDLKDGSISTDVIEANTVGADDVNAERVTASEKVESPLFDFGSVEGDIAPKFREESSPPSNSTRALGALYTTDVGAVDFENGDTLEYTLGVAAREYTMVDSLVGADPDSILIGVSIAATMQNIADALNGTPGGHNALTPLGSGFVAVTEGDWPEWLEIPGLLFGVVVYQQVPADLAFAFVLTKASPVNWFTTTGQGFVAAPGNIVLVVDPDSELPQLLIRDSLGFYRDIQSVFSSLKITVNELVVTGTAQIPSGTKAADDPGVAGQVSFDADYFYVCVATDTWKRAALNVIAP